MKILAIETSADDTAAAVVENTQIISSVKHTQLEHADWGGIVPSIAKRDHLAWIDPVINQAMTNAKSTWSDIDAVAVTVGPGLAIALEVGIAKAKELAIKYNKPLIAVNHIEGHILSALTSTSPLPPPNLGGGDPQIGGGTLALAVSGGHTQIILIKKIGDYKILVESKDDNIGEAIDKGARILGLPYPGGPALEKLASQGDSKKHTLPLPMAGKEGKSFSYSGLKSAFFRLVNQFPDANKADLAACYQAMVFKHLIRTLKKVTENRIPRTEHLLVGGGVIANQELRKRLTSLGEELGIQVHFAPMEYTGDNAAMIGVAAYFKATKNEFVKDFDSIDRLPRWKVDQKN